MKKLLLILFFSLFLFPLSGQYISDDFKYKKSFKESKIPESVKVISIYAGSIILNAIGDGLNDSGEKSWGHACNATSIGLLLSSPFIIDYDKSKLGYYLTTYVGLRYSLFDASYNLSRGLPYDYIGNTATTDKIFSKAPANFRTFTKGISLIVSVSLPITKITRR